MLSDKAVQYLTPLTYKEDAERSWLMLPLSGIYWKDEIPDMKEMYKLGDVRNEIWRLLSIRQMIWAEQELTEDDQEFWDSARMQVPDYAAFQRLFISEEDRQAQNQTEQGALEFMDAMISDADEYSTREVKPGVSEYSVTFDLSKHAEETTARDSWWKRILNESSTSVENRFICEPDSVITLVLPLQIHMMILHGSSTHHSCRVGAVSAHGWG